jgi:ribosomal protein S18 acetylase RimI-like enzyme
MTNPDQAFSNLTDYSVRTPEIEDAPAVAGLFNHCSQLISGRNVAEPIDFENLWQSPDFDRLKNVRLVFSPGGELVGYGSVNCHAPYVHVRHQLRVLPDHQLGALPDAILAWGEARARQYIDQAPPDAEVLMRCGIDTKDAFARDLYARHGMAVVRYFQEMVIELGERPAEPEIPAGIGIRPFDQKTELEQVVLAYQDSFQDHFGYVEEPLDKIMEALQYMMDKDPHFDPEVQFVAMDGDEVAGFSLCATTTVEDPEMGYINVLGVRRAWRKRGLGLALLRHSFRKLYDKEAKRVGLDVDTASLTGATRLYEKAGMSVTRQYESFAKVLRPGKDLSTQSI